jgi:Concanavalin A-like lectin/glucanases superfamily
MTSPHAPFELILSHQYGTGAALDASGYENNGRVVGEPQRVPGSQPGTWALAFDGIDDRIVVVPSVSLRDIAALRVDALVWLDELGGRRTIVEGYGCFSLLVEPDGTLEGTIYNGSRWEGVRSPANGMPLGRWVQVSYIYDGTNTSVLCLNRQLLCVDNRALGRIDTLDWPFGLNVGAWPDRDGRMFKGRIEYLKIWRRAIESRPPPAD